MKRFILLGALISMLAVLPSQSAINVQEQTEAEYLINSGYSQSVAEDVFMVKNRALGKPIEPLYDKNQNCLVRLWKKFHSYVDPAVEREDRLHHDIRLSPSYSDL